MAIKNTLLGVWNKGLTKETDERIKKMADSRKKQITFICKTCKKEFHRNKSQRLRAKYCSVKCRNKGYKKQHFSINTEIKKGDTRNQGEDYYLDKSTGYKLIMRNNNKIYEHRNVWMLNHGLVSIPSGSVIHHINLDKTDNRIENLALLDRATHLRLHKMLRGEC